ncbi:MAG: hypothetical protein HETSPECPRED_008965 [Heterodermia speciosa]|uniref:Uncharacterized protein n=1 Tax=Heterodermia speciosa TaxID=116794 RepID=A0A8H3EQ58_9LECA|nr:MAG: hypothetical protein HETSPECPRED_008965 [Heterodermia speciosa]
MPIKGQTDYLQVYAVVTAHSTITAGRPLRPSRKLSDHIEKNSDEPEYQISERSYIIGGGTDGARQEAQVQRSHHSIPLSCPFRENKTFRAFPADNRAQKAEYEQR